MMKDNASTDVIVHRGEALASFYQCDMSCTASIRTRSRPRALPMGWLLPREGVPPPRVDEHTGELLFNSYGIEAPYMHYGVVSPAGELVTYIDVPLPGPRLLRHDVHGELDDPERPAAVRDPEALASVPTPTCSGVTCRAVRAGTAARLHRGHPVVRADPTFVLHWTNAYEDGDEVVLDNLFQHNPTARGVDRSVNVDPKHKGFETLDMNVLQARHHRWRFNLVTGETREEPLSETCSSSR